MSSDCSLHEWIFGFHWTRAIDEQQDALNKLLYIMLASAQDSCDDRVLGTKQHSSNEAKVAPLSRIIRLLTEIQRAMARVAF